MVSVFKNLIDKLKKSYLIIKDNGALSQVKMLDKAEFPK
jgi:hypothetical protein